MQNGTTYDSLYRHTARGILGLLVALVLIGALAWHSLDMRENEMAVTMLGGGGVVIVMVALFTMTCIRRHRWTIEADGIIVDERPSVRFTGSTRHARIAFADLAALEWIDSGLQTQMALVTHDGRRRHLAQAILPGQNGIVAQPDQAKPLAPFAEGIAAAAGGAGFHLPIRHVLGVWDRGPGIALLLGLLVLTGALAIVVAWAVIDGGVRGGDAAAMFLALPFWIGWLLHKALRRRRELRASAA